jgi:hypothetical protein
MRLVPGPTGNEGYEAVVRAAAELLRPGGLSRAGARLEERRGGSSDRCFATGSGPSWVADLQGSPECLTARR